MFLLIGRVDFLLSRRDFAPISGSRDLAIEIITGVAAHESKPDERSRPAGLFVLAARRILRAHPP